VACIDDMKIPQNISGGKHENNKSLGRARQIWEDNIKINFKATACKSVGGFNWLGAVCNDSHF
jgi:hypothetical protein